jgi:fatty acid desaturase
MHVWRIEVDRQAIRLDFSSRRSPINRVEGFKNMRRNAVELDGPAGILTGATDDHSNSFERIRSHLTDSRGIRLIDYVGQLKPIYWRVYLDIAIGYTAMVAVIALVVVGQTAEISSLLLVPVGAALIGAWYFYLLSFLHEGVHYNLAPDRRVNDLVCNVLMSWMIGVSLAAYRRRHFEHHRSLGTIRDTETTYFLALNMTALLKSVLGARALEALLSYVSYASRQAKGKRIEQRALLPVTPAIVAALMAAVVVHGSIVGGLWASGSTAAAFAWIAGVGMVMPVLNTVRQVLEHRHPHARRDVDYSRTDQGACTRMFGNGPIDRLFGAAGANRHLVHHWEPQVPYARLAELERFLADTPARALMDRRRTTYVEALRQLFAS